MSFRERLARAEARFRSDGGAQDMAACPMTFWPGLGRIAEAYPDEAATITHHTRLSRFTPMQHVAWVLRFRKGPFSIAAIYAEHGETPPDWFDEADLMV